MKLLTFADTLCGGDIMSVKNKKREVRPLSVNAASASGCTGLMPTPAEEEEERLAYSEIETLQTDETIKAGIEDDAPKKI
jgi:hypothetical protein